jgi:hypothetical protein
VPDIAPLDPGRIIKTLDRHGVEFVLIGALAARLYGFPRLTADADITPADDAENMGRLAKALRELHARVFTESVPEGLVFDCSAATLGRAQMWNLVTDAGRIDVAFRPAGTRGYEDLVSGAEKFFAQFKRSIRSRRGRWLGLKSEKRARREFTPGSQKLRQLEALILPPPLP